ncbi:MAG: hypothetical protein GF399_12670 [Candidatus Coatesbacteria bacterium]|nr:hypothetical protein [Candidatus Coatesbacteria bacterium]
MLTAFQPPACDFTAPAVPASSSGGPSASAGGPDRLRRLSLSCGVCLTRHRCSHRPDYAENSPILHCPANHGAPRLLPYRPGPLEGWERSGPLIRFARFGAAPLVAAGLQTARPAAGTTELLDLWGAIILTTALLFTIVGFFVLRRVHPCRRYVNLSCPPEHRPRRPQGGQPGTQPHLDAAGWKTTAPNKTTTPTKG